MNKSTLGLLAIALSPLSVLAQQRMTGGASASALPDAPSATLAAATSSAVPEPPQSATQPQDAAPVQQTPSPQASPAPDPTNSGSAQQTGLPQQSAPAPTPPGSSPQQPAGSAADQNAGAQNAGTQNAQSQPTPPQQPQTQPQTQTPEQTQAQTPEQRRAQAAKELKQEESQRMLGVIPNFNTVIGGQAEPLTSGQKFHLFFKSSVDPFQFFAAGVDAGIEQGENSYPEYHQGFEGFAKRYGAAFADSFDGNFWGNAVLPSLLHQDPRYFRLGHGSFKHRLLYSISTVIRTKGDNGKWQPNYSNVAGNFIGGAISNAYYPASDRGVGLTLERGLTVTAEGTIGSLAVEFYPDVVQHYKNKRLRQQQTQPAADGTTATPKP